MLTICLRMVCECMCVTPFRFLSVDVVNASPLSVYLCAERSTSVQPSQKTLKIKTKLAKKAKQNRPIPYWFRLKTDNKIRYGNCISTYMDT